jgi:heterotetrameric sarcosine oxidase gamma subunit
VLVRAAAAGGVGAALGVGFGRAARDRHGSLVVGSGPDEWLLLAPPGTAAAVAARVRAAPDDGLVSVLDATHDRALVRLSGAASAALLARVCAIDLAEEVTPDGAAFRSDVAGVVTDVVRDDRGGERSYLLHCERSFGQYLFDALLDAGADLGIEVDGFAGPGT